MVQTKEERKAKTKQYAKKYREKNKEKINIRGKKFREELKLEVFSTLSKLHSNSKIPCCRCCGESSYIEFLTIEHIEGRKNLPKKEQKLKGEKLNLWTILMDLKYYVGIVIYLKVHLDSVLMRR